MKAKACNCAGRGKPRHNLVRVFVLLHVGDCAPGPDIYGRFALDFCPRCRQLHRAVIRTDRQWTESETEWFQKRADEEYAEWHKDVYGPDGPP